MKRGCIPSQASVFHTWGILTGEHPRVICQGRCQKNIRFFSLETSFVWDGDPRTNCWTQNLQLGCLSNCWTNCWRLSTGCFNWAMAVALSFWRIWCHSVVISRRDQMKKANGCHLDMRPLPWRICEFLFSYYYFFSIFIFRSFHGFRGILLVHAKQKTQCHNNSASFFTGLREHDNRSSVPCTFCL